MAVSLMAGWSNIVMSVKSENVQLQRMLKTAHIVVIIYVKNWTNGLKMSRLPENDWIG